MSYHTNWGKKSKLTGHLDHSEASDVLRGEVVGAVRVINLQLVYSIWKIQEAHTDRNKGDAWKEDQTNNLRDIKFQRITRGTHQLKPSGGKQRKKMEKDGDGEKQEEAKCK